MAKPKRVAIIGAGPSGLVMAKTLLRNFPPGTFAPVIFEKKRRIGGLWAVDYPADVPSSSADSPGSSRAFVDPWMRTNLSRFSVAFSDLSWETALGDRSVPLFPRAWEVRRYLERYVEIFVPGECLKLGRRVLRVGRRREDVGKAGMQWEVFWVDEGECEENLGVQKDGFDFLVVASGHFGTPNIPHISGLQDFPNKVHSSELQSPEDMHRLLEKSPKGGKLVVIGGSMSGVEAATSLALHLSSLRFSPGSSQGGNAFEVWHVGTGPYWVLPTYLPHRYGDDAPHGKAMSFVPLDLSLYDLGRRPPGMNGVAFGPVSPEQISKRNQFFRDMLGKDYREIGGINLTDDQGRENERPPLVGIADYYAEFVRSGAIKNMIGRACSVSYSEPDLGTIGMGTTTGLTPLAEVAAIVMATGFKPSDSLSFLPQDILSTLEYTKDDHFLPLILDKWSTAHSEIPDLGFVGFYRGAFWGPAELQAQSLAQNWATVDLENKVPICLSEEEQLSRAVERQKVRDFRDFQPTTLRGQFPLGDYVGLMETLAGKVGRHRLPIRVDPGRDVQPVGPVVPARYPPVPVGRDYESPKGYVTQKEVGITMEALNSILFAEPGKPCMGTTAVIFRALHGQWRFERVVIAHADDGSGSETRSFGKTMFHPRYPSRPDHEAEYLCEEMGDDSSATTIRTVYGLRDTSQFPNQPGIRVWSVDEGTSPNSAAGRVLELHVAPAGEVVDSGETIIEARNAGASPLTQNTYGFCFDRVAIAHWCHHLVCQEGNGTSRSTTQYSRPADG